jgi:tRNA A-37 threonylcarbamoyl transferase component Bud32/predicted nucleotidyltransferase
MSKLGVYDGRKNMRNLTLSEGGAIRETLEKLSSKSEIVALCIYGSQVSGYATKDSDYDVILVQKPFKQRIKYYYLKSETECAVLVVDPSSFENDCKKSSLGEFASGRLLNPYFPLEGETYIREMETAYKRRVILEGLSDAYSEYSDFTSQIIFPIRYFLFEKLRKRAAIYPPVVYSYTMTYGEALLQENLEFALGGFRRAAEELMKEGLIEFNSLQDTLVPSKKFGAGILSRLGAAASYTNKSIRQYAVHGYAGRVTPNVVGKEVISKISRSRRSGKLPEYIQNPRSSWSLPAGKLFASSRDWLTDLLKHLEFDRKTCKISNKSMGEFYTSAGFYTIRDDRKAVKLAVKRYQDIKGMKWGVLNLWSLKNADFTANPMERMYREYKAIQDLRSFGLSTPEMIAIFLDQKMAITQFVEGKDLSRLESEYLNGESEDTTAFECFGRDLGIMHNNGYCMGDTKPSNTIFTDDSKIFFVDLEQAKPGTNKTWDVAEFIYYSARFTLKEDKLRKIIGAFLHGYQSSTKDPNVVRDSASFRFRAPFQPFIAPNILSAIQSDLKK